MADELFLASWGRIRLFCTELETESGRTKVVHDLTNGDLHPTQDRGRKARRAKAKLAFDDFQGFPDPVTAAKTMEAAVATGQAAMFSHPLIGSYLAGIGDFSWRIDESGIITADAEFIPEGEVPTVSPAGAGTTAASGEGSVAAAADDFDAATADTLTDTEKSAALTNPDGVSVADDARQSSASWSLIDTPIRQVVIDAARISDEISNAIEVGRFELDLALWPAYRAAIMLGDAMRGAAIAATSEVPTTFVMRIQNATALLPLCARIYGGVDAVDRARQVAQLNDIQTPAWLAPGDYLFPNRSAAQRSAF